MLREIRVGDADQISQMMIRNFPEEERILGTDPEGVPRIARRFERWDARFILGFFRLFRRPIFRFFVLESDGRIAATTMLTFAARSAYVSLVMVDPPFRRRGYARRLLDAARKGAASAGRPYISLDVLETNAAARQLYTSLGYQALRSQTFFTRPLAGGSAPPAPPPAPEIRPFRRSDEARLAKILNATLPPRVREILPSRARDFQVPAVVARSLGSVTEAWVVDRGRGPLAFVRATTSDTMRAGHLTRPVQAPEVDAGTGSALLRTAIRWLEQRGAPTAVCEVPDDATREVASLSSEGFAPSLRMVTMYRPTTA